MKNKLLYLTLTLLSVSLLFSHDAFSQNTVVRVVPYSLSNPYVGHQFGADIVIENGRNVAGYQVMLEFEYPAIELVRIQQGNYLPADTFLTEPSFIGGNGRLFFAATASPHERNGSGTLATLTFKINEVRPLTFRLSAGDPSRPRHGTILSNKDVQLSYPRLENADIFHGIGVYDLVVEPPEVSEPIVAPGEDFTLTVTVTNQGGGITPGIHLFYYLSTDPHISRRTDTQIDGRSLSSLGANRSDTVSKTLTAPTSPGTYYYGACVNSIVGEADPDNNCSKTVKITVAEDTPEPVITPPPEIIEIITTITGPPEIGEGTIIGPVQSQPDLVIESVRTEPSTVAPGEKFKLYATLKNQGTLRSSESTLRYYSSTNNIISTSDTQIRAVSRDPLPKGGTIRKYLEVPAPTAPGTYYYGVCVDEVENESNTGNNCYIDAVSVTVKPPDLTLPPDLISEVAFGPNSTYFIVTSQFPELTGIDGLDVIYKKGVTMIDLPDNTQHFWFPLEERETGGGLGELGLDVTVSLAGAGVGCKVGGVIGAAVGAVPGAALGCAIGSYTVPLIYTVGKHFWNVHDEKKEAERSRLDPVIELKSDKEIPGRPRDKFRILVLIQRQVRNVKVGIGLEYKLNSEKRRFASDPIYSLVYEETLPLTRGALAAPSAQPMSLSDYPPFQMLSSEIQEYLLQHFGEGENAEAWQIPEEPALLVNYPNPFNPETWLPYQLAEPADVTVTIYDIQGRVVRHLDLGHQRAGIYQSKTRAAYWDGRNAQGEPVASGVYFYTLKAGDFSATRKMLIRK